MSVVLSCDRCGLMLDTVTIPTWYTCHHYLNKPTKDTQGAFIPLVQESHLCASCQAAYIQWCLAGVPTEQAGG